MMTLSEKLLSEVLQINKKAQNHPTYGRLDDNKDNPHFRKGDKCIYKGIEYAIIDTKWNWVQYSDDPEWSYSLSNYPRRVVGSALHQVLRPKDTKGGSLSYEEIIIACKNIGFNLECGACAMLFYTGFGGYEHEPNCNNKPGDCFIGDVKFIEPHASNTDLERGHTWASMPYTYEETIEAESDDERLGVAAAKLIAEIREETIEKCASLCLEFRRKKGIGLDARVFAEEIRKLNSKPQLECDCDQVFIMPELGHQPRPTYNHNRDDGPYNPCDICLERMDKEELLRFIKELKYKISILLPISSPGSM
jgi:hypothetical protein